MRSSRVHVEARCAVIVTVPEACLIRGHLGGTRAARRVGRQEVADEVTAQGEGVPHALMIALQEVDVDVPGDVRVRE